MQDKKINTIASLTNQTYDSIKRKLDQINDITYKKIGNVKIFLPTTYEILKISEIINKYPRGYIIIYKTGLKKAIEVFEEYIPSDENYDTIIARVKLKKR